MRKLIGHSGPVYSLSFDPIYGSSSAPQTLLSSSQDGTVRLWSMDTYSNLVVYRGHNRDPVWDVQWGPMGVYFATASRDRTARLWCSDRTSPVRMYTGHMGDVNVSLLLLKCLGDADCSACDSIPTRCILPRGLTTSRSACGMCNEALVSGC
jgi:WD40 repeat protein